MSGDEKEVKIDADNKMLVRDVPVNLPERVQVVDSRYGKRIGYIDREEVMKVLEDPCFLGFEDTASGEFMISYGTETIRRTIELITDSPIEFFKIIEDNVETAIGCDNPKKIRIGASYIDKSGRNCLVEINVRHLKGVFHLINSDLKDAIMGDGSEESQLTGPGERIVNYFREKHQ